MHAMETDIICTGDQQYLQEVFWNIIPNL